MLAFSGPKTEKMTNILLDEATNSCSSQTARFSRWQVREPPTKQFKPFSLCCLPLSWKNNVLCHYL